MDARHGEGSPKRGLMADSLIAARPRWTECYFENRVGRMPAESVSQENGLNLSSM